MYEITREYCQHFPFRQCNKWRRALLLLPSLISRRTTNCRTSSWLGNFRSAMISLSFTLQAQSGESHVAQWHPWCSSLCRLSSLGCNSSGRAPSSPSQRACGSWMPSRDFWHNLKIKMELDTWILSKPCIWNIEVGRFVSFSKSMCMAIQASLSKYSVATSTI